MVRTNDGGISGAWFERDGGMLTKHCANAREQVGQLVSMPSYMTAPTIVRVGSDRYTMRFIDGSSLLELCTKRRLVATYFVQQLLTIIDQNRRQSMLVEMEHFTRKVRSIAFQSPTLPRPLRGTLWLSWQSILDMMPDEILLPMGFAHGDLTPENIIIDQRMTPHFIDAIPSPVSTILQDVSKLRQEFLYGWSSVRHGLDYDRRHYQGIVDGRFPTTRELLTLDFVTIARIAPYAGANERISEWITQRLCQILSCYAQALPTATVDAPRLS
jgi:serine/threonine protein kinase